jgi:hypothetical protein
MLMSTHHRKFYTSENGDEWWLCRQEGGRVLVLHEAYLSSGGKITKMEIAEFLGTNGTGPQHQSLLRLIGELAVV